MALLSEFVLMNTQRGKTAFTKQLVLKYINDQNHTYIPFFVLDNNTSLALQTQDAMKDVATCFALHSLANNTEQQIIEYITNSIDNDKPFVFALNNQHQIPRLARIMTTAKRLGFEPILVVDEADKTYPLCRHALYDCTDRWIFVSATLGHLHDFPECAAAVIAQPIQDNIAYRGVITQDARLMTYTVTNNKEEDALQFINQRRDYFFERVVCTDGQLRHRKVLIHGSYILRMVQLTKDLAAQGWGVVCVIGPGTFAAKDGRIVAGVKNKKITVAQSIAALCAQFNLGDDRPLAVIGNRKMDRGITFHNWNDGIIFTDCILGNVNNTDSAVQKAGRLAGNIALRPQYTGILTWWANNTTIEHIVNQHILIHNANNSINIAQLLYKGKFHIIGPFKHYSTLKKHKHITHKQHKICITYGATIHSHTINISLKHAFTLLKNYQCFAAKINNYYYILKKPTVP